MLKYRILGPVEVVDERGPIKLGGARQRSTLALLLLHANQVVPVERLAEDLYGGSPPFTAITQVQRQVSDLRKVLGQETRLETQPRGYVLRLPVGALDLGEFERCTSEAARAFEMGQFRVATTLVTEGLDLWRGTPLADLPDLPFVRRAATRLNEIRLAAIELHIDAELALGKHRDWIPELQQLTDAHPLREMFAKQLMIALYRAGRQAEALAVYRTARSALVRDLGVEPSRTLQDLERRILGQEASLEWSQNPRLGRTPQSTGRVTLALPRSPLSEGLISIVAALASLPDREVVVAQLVGDVSDLTTSAGSLRERYSSVQQSVRTVVLTSLDFPNDASRLAEGYQAELILVETAPELAETLPDDLSLLLETAPADVAVVVGQVSQLGNATSVLVPFGGGDHDWAALEFAALLVLATGGELTILGTRATSDRGDATRLLADASLALQRLIGLTPTPRLSEPTVEGLLAAAADASLIVVGVAPGWRAHGVGRTRRALLKGTSPVLFMHRGPRPGGLAPRESRTRFTWTAGDTPTD